MILFGLGWGNAPIVEHAVWRDTPVGEECFSCGDEILRTDSGCIMTCIEQIDPRGDWTEGNLINALRPQHRECNLRQILGGVNHQRQTCHCYGGADDPDPPGMTRHEAAIEAVREFERTSRAAR